MVFIVLGFELRRRLRSGECAVAAIAAMVDAAECGKMEIGDIRHRYLLPLFVFALFSSRCPLCSLHSLSIFCACSALTVSTDIFGEERFDRSICVLEQSVFRRLTNRVAASTEMESGVTSGRRSHS